MVVADLDDVFAEVGFGDVDTSGEQRVMKPDLLGHHALALDALFELVLLADVDYVGVRLCRVCRPQDVSASGADVRLHLF
jgi:hypothetical protein